MDCDRWGDVFRNKTRLRVLALVDRYWTPFCRVWDSFKDARIFLSKKRLTHPEQQRTVERLVDDALLDLLNASVD